MGRSYRADDDHKDKQKRGRRKKRKPRVDIKHDFDLMSADEVIAAIEGLEDEEEVLYYEDRS